MPGQGLVVHLPVEEEQDMALGAHSAESQDAVSQGLNNNLEFFQLLLLATESTSQESALSSKLTEHCPRYVRATILHLCQPTKCPLSTDMVGAGDILSEKTYI